MELIPPFKVITDKVTSAARDIGISYDQLVGNEEIPAFNVNQQARKFVLGEPLVSSSMKKRSFYQHKCKDCMSGT